MIMNKVILIILETFLPLAWTLSCSPVGTTAYDPDVNNRVGPGEGHVYLNLNEVAMCNGTVYGWRYCSHEDVSDPPLELVLAMYRPLRNGTYQMVPGSRYQLRLEENNFDSFTCGNITLEPSEHFAVQENDVVAFCEEIDTARVELYSSQRGRSVWYWNAGGCSESRISSTGVPSRRRNRVFLLSAFIDPEESSDGKGTDVTSDQGGSDDGLGEGAVAAIVIIVMVVVASAVAVGVVIAIFFYYKRERVGDRSIDNKVYYEQPESTTETSTNTRTVLPNSADDLAGHDYEMENGPQPGHVYEMGNFLELDTNAENYVYTQANELNTDEPNSPHDVQSYYSSIIHKAVEEDIYGTLTHYQAPAEKEDDLYRQITSYHIKTIPRNQIKKIAHLGSGEFGNVDKGLWTSDRGEVEVAVKTLAESSNTVRFLQEAAIMAQFRHPNIVALRGVVSHGTPKMLVLEFMHKGDLHCYLNTLRSNTRSMPNISKTLLNFSKHIALGLHYLSSIGFVHRDLAARNILVSKNNILKIADFGMSRDLTHGDIYVSHGGMIPVRWTALEALRYKKYSTASDVWSYGCVLYEIWSLGHKPFETQQSKEIVRLLKSGYRLPPPPGCPKVIYQLMVDCWHPGASSRPQPKDVLKALLVDEVMAIPPEDVPAGAKADVLGAPLSTATHLYPTLQNMYRTQSH